MKININNKVYPLSGRGKEVYYSISDKYTEIKWGDLEFKLPNNIYELVLNEFMLDKSKWYTLGVSMTEPVPGGLGDFLSSIEGLTPRHGSAIAAIMYNEGMIEYRGKRPIEIRKL